MRHVVFSCSKNLSLLSPFRIDKRYQGESLSKDLNFSPLTLVDPSKTTMVLVAEKQLEKAISVSDASNVSILGIEYGSILLFTGTTSSSNRSSSSVRSFLGGINLLTNEQKLYYRHPTPIKITHASISLTRSLACFVTRSTDPVNFEVFMIEIKPSNATRLFSLKYDRPTSIKAYLTLNDALILMNRDVITLFRLSNTGHALEGSMSLDRNAHKSDCLYYQWDTLIQRLHVIQRRDLNLMSSNVPAAGHESLSYFCYTVNSKGHFQEIVSINFDVPTTVLSTSQPNFEILSSNDNLFVCWQSSLRERTAEIRYIVVSLGHGATVTIKHKLNSDNWEIFRSRKVHFGLLPGNYVFVLLRAEFVHLLDFNVHSNFRNHLFLPDTDDNDIPYDTRYTTQRGLTGKLLTLLYEKKDLFTYSIQVDMNRLINAIKPSIFNAATSYIILAGGELQIIGGLLQKILSDFANLLYTKNYLKEILTAMIFGYLLKRFNDSKYPFAFPSTTLLVHEETTDKPDLSFQLHHRDSLPIFSRSSNTDNELIDKLLKLFEYARKHRRKLPFSYSNVRQTRGNHNEKLLLPARLQSATREEKQLFKHVLSEIDLIRPSWEQSRREEIVVDYVLQTQKKCDLLLKIFSRLASFDRTYPLNMAFEQDHHQFHNLLLIVEKLYLAMDELGFPITDELERMLLELSFRVLPFDRFAAALDQNILTLSEEFVTRVVLELKDEPKFYDMKEQLIMILANDDYSLKMRLFGLIENDRAKQTSAQLVVAQRLLTEKAEVQRMPNYSRTVRKEIHIDEMISDQDIEENSRILEHGAVQFYRECYEQGVFTEEELNIIKSGLFALVSSKNKQNNR